MSKYKCIFIAGSIWLSTGCVHHLAMFVEQPDSLKHMPTGTVVQKKADLWSLEQGSVQENTSPEILATIPYQYLGADSMRVSNSKVFILKSKSTANVSLIENHILRTLGSGKHLSTRVQRLPSGKKVIISEYSHLISREQASGGGSKKIDNIMAISWFATPEKSSNIAAWISCEGEVSRKPATDAQIAASFFDKMFSDSK